MDYLALVSIGFAFFIVTASPGPATISCAAVAMSSGRVAGLTYAAGLSCGLAFWGLIAASGMGAVLQGSVYWLMMLKLLGGLYLLWLAFLSARSAWWPAREQAAKPGGRSWFAKGLILNLSNPKAVVAWMAALSIGIDSNDGPVLVALATAVCIIVGCVCYAGYSILFSITAMARGYQHCSRMIDGVVAGLFSVAGVALIRSAFARQP